MSVLHSLWRRTSNSPRRDFTTGASDCFMPDGLLSRLDRKRPTDATPRADSRLEKTTTGMFINLG